MRLSTRTGALAALLFALAALPAHAQQVVRVGHFPNITHVQALVARNFERQGQGWFGSASARARRSSGTPTTPARAPWRRSSPTRSTSPMSGRARRSTRTRSSRGEEIRIVAGARQRRRGPGGPAGLGARQRPRTSRASGSPRRSSATRRTSRPAPGWPPAACGSRRPAATRRSCRPPTRTSWRCSAAGSSTRSGRSSPGCRASSSRPAGSVLVEETDAVTTVPGAGVKFLKQQARSRPPLRRRPRAS